MTPKNPETTQRIEKAQDTEFLKSEVRWPLGKASENQTLIQKGPL